MSAKLLQQSFNKDLLLTLIRRHITSSRPNSQSRDQTQDHTTIISECSLAELTGPYTGIDAVSDKLQ